MLDTYRCVLSVCRWCKRVIDNLISVQFVERGTDIGSESMPGADGALGVVGDDKPTFCNFFVCRREPCDTLCFNHHPTIDAPALTETEIKSSICSLPCLREHCSVSPQCSSFWKQQREIANNRKIRFKLSEKNRVKCVNYQSEISTLRASMERTNDSSYTDEVLSAFGSCFAKFRELEDTVKTQFKQQLFGKEKRIKESESEVAKLQIENTNLKRKFDALELDHKALFESLRKRNKVFDDKTD